MKQKHYIIIDFDSTFIKVETIDEIAKISLANHDGNLSIIQQIEEITNNGMNGNISFQNSLEQRLALLKANNSHIKQVVSLLKSKVTNSFLRNKIFFQKCADAIYIISSGFKECILPITQEFGIKDEHVYANNFIFDDNGNIIGIDKTNPLASDGGKATIVKSLGLSGEISVIGDGYTDYEIKEQGYATKFYAFTENVKRERVINVADVILPSLDEFLYLNKLPMTNSYPRNRIKVLLLENIHKQAYDLFVNQGYTVETLKGALNEDDLSEKIKGVSILGIRSKTNITAKVLENADRLMAIGAFCIGTNQIDLHAAANRGICAFNAPYSNTRSVVELVIGNIIMLLRHVVNKNNQLHNGKWDKSANNSFEVRGKKIGIIGYGNIGSQLSVIAEAFGMHVYYYDVTEKLQLGNAHKCETMEKLLSTVDIVTLHVDGRKENKNLIGEREFSQMKNNVIFINLSRGHVVDIEALVNNLKNNKIMGAAIDVFPYEPKDNAEEFISELRGFNNVILTPHIGGSTEEAQFNIGEFVAKRLISYVNSGDTTQSVNFPNLQLPNLNKAHRLIHIHENVPGILAQINQQLANHNINILGQYLKTNENIGYVITDINTEHNEDVICDLKSIKHTIKSRVLY